MQTAPLLSQLGETHGVLVYHAASLPPAKLLVVFKEYGKPSMTRTYTLADSNYATVVFFSEARSNVACYVSLSLLAQESNSCGIGSVGWLHETAEETFAQRPYVQGPYVAPTPLQPSSSPTAPAEEGYVAVYWKGVALHDRAAVTQLAQQAATEVFEDEKEGGRSFLRFPTEDAADAFHSLVCRQHPSLRRSLSYADATDFMLAKQSA